MAIQFRDRGRMITNRQSTGPKAPSNSWHAPWLSRPVLSAFLVAFLLFATSLGIISRLNADARGFPMRLTENHYTWTYGPTVILVCVVGLWRRVSYSTMISQPWHDLSEGSPREAAKTVLLDYMWPLQVCSFAKALRNRHFAVSAAILIFVLLKIIIVVSTALFVPGESLISQPVRLFAETEFNSTDFWDQVTWRSLGGQGEDSAAFFENLSSDPFRVYMNLLRDGGGALVNSYDLSTAFTNFSIQTKIPGREAYVEGEVDVFRPNTTCKEAEVDWSWTKSKGEVDLTVRTPSCRAGRTSTPTNLWKADGRETGNYFLVERVNCTGERFPGEISFQETTPHTYQYAVIMAEIDWRNATKGNQDRALRVAALSCELSYTIGKATVSASSLVAGSLVVEGMMDNGTDGESIAGFTDLQYAEAVMATLEVAEPSFHLTEEDVRLSVGTGLGRRALVGLIAGLTEFSESIDDTDDLRSLFDAIHLRHRTEQVLNAIGHQLMRHYFLRPVDNGKLTWGTIHQDQLRLQVRPLALWTMFGLLITAAGLVIVVMLYMKQEGVAPPNPTALATSACTLARSPDLVELLRGSGGENDSQMRRRLEGYAFAAVSCGDGGFRLKVSVHDQHEKGQGKGQEKEEGKEKEEDVSSSEMQRPLFTARLISWMRRDRATSTTNPTWTPYIARRTVTALTFLLPLACVAILEVLGHLSQTDKRFLITSSDSSVRAYAVRYSTVITVLVIATLFNCLDFAIATMASFSALKSRGEEGERGGRRDGASGESALAFSMVADLPPLALYKAIRNRHAGPSLSLIASTVGSMLTIAASGLWFLDSAHVSAPATAKIHSGWEVDFAAVNGTQRMGTGTPFTEFNHVQQGARSQQYTQGLVWHHRIVLPKIVETKLETGLEGMVAYNLAVPALQAALECSLVPPSLVEMNLTSQEIMASASLPEGCNWRSHTDHGKRIVLCSSTHNHTSRPPSKDPYWYGHLYSLDIQPTLTDSESDGAVSSDGCPSIGALFGRYNVESSGDRDHSHPGKREESKVTDYDLIGMICTQRLQAIEANLTSVPTPAFHNGFTLDDKMPLHLNTHEGSPRFLVDPQTNVSSLSFAMAHQFQQHSTPLPGVPQTMDLDRFFSHLTYGPEGIPPDELVDAEVLKEAINALYQKFMAFVISTAYRVPLNDSTAVVVESGEHGRSQLLPDDGIVRGTSTQTVTLLKVSRTSKIVLQVMLGTMVLLGGLANKLVRIRAVLPRSPYPIASSMALFEGSSLLDIFRGEDEQREDEPEKNVKNLMEILMGRRFRLGWWDRTTGGASTTGSDEEEPLTSVKWFGIDVVEDPKDPS